MFAFARSIFRHKVGVIAVLAFAVFMFTRDGGDNDGKSANPWSQHASVAAAAPKQGDSVVGKAVSAASDYIGEATGIDPAQVAEDSVGNFNKTNDAYAKANAR